MADKISIQDSDSEESKTTITSDEEIEDRIERAQNRETTFTVAGHDPLVVTVETNHSDDVHTIVPDSLHCSCPDFIYRDGPCYHILALGMDSQIGSASIREQIERRVDTHQSSVNFHKDKLEDAQAKLRLMKTAFDAIEEHGEELFDYQLDTVSGDVDAEAIVGEIEETMGPEDSETTTEQPRDEQGRFTSPSTENDSEETQVEINDTESNDDNQFRQLIDDIQAQGGDD